MPPKEEPTDAEQVAQLLQADQDSRGLPLSAIQSNLLLQHLQALYFAECPPQFIASHAAALLRNFNGRELVPGQGYPCTMLQHQHQQNHHLAAGLLGLQHHYHLQQQQQLQEQLQAQTQRTMANPGQLTIGQQPHLAPPPSSDPRTVSSIIKVFETDDLLGQVYSRIKASEDKRSLRHCSRSCYRSSAINSCITSLTIGRQRNYNGTAYRVVQDPLAVLAAFPRHAKLRELIIKGDVELGGDIKYHACGNNLGAMVERLRGPEGVAARERLLDVGSLFLQDCTLTEDCATALPLLFPNLMHAPTNQLSPSPVRKLTLWGTHSSSEAIKILASQLSGLTELKMLEVSLEEQDELADAVACFTSLIKMELVACDIPILTVEPLAAMRKLEELILSGFGVAAEGLEEVLEHVPLKILSLDDVCFNSQPRLGSATLRCLQVAVNSTYPELAPQCFPQLQALQLREIQLISDVWQVPGAEEAELQALECVIGAISSGFPLEVPVSLQGAATFDSSQSEKPIRSFGISNEHFGLPRSSSTTLAVLKLLLPLAPVLRSVERFTSWQFEFNSEALNTMVFLFPGLVHMSISDGFIGTEFSGLLALPRLQQACIQTEQVPTDVISTLMSAKSSGRPFCLELSCFGKYTSLIELKKVWDEVVRRMPAASNVVFEVR